MTTVLLGVLASGHILIEDLPGLGKTLLARTFATVLGLEFTRVQFTPDMLPADLTGAMVLDLTTGEAAFRPGPARPSPACCWPTRSTAPRPRPYLRVSDRAGLVVLGGMLRWVGPAAGDRQFYRVAEMMLAARFDSFVTPDVGRILRTALPPGTLVVVFSPLLDPRGFGAITDLRQRMTPQPRFRHDHEGYSVGRDSRVFMIKKTSFQGTGAALGLLTVAWPLAWAPGWAYAVAAAGAVAVLAGAFARWRRGPVLAVAAAVAACAFSRAGTLVLAAEGLFILCYLLAADAPAGLSPGARPGSWLRYQALGVVAGLIASGEVVAALAVQQASSAALTAAGLAAAAGAYLVALPSRQVPRQVPRRVPRQVPRQVPRRESDVDVQ